MRIDIKKISAVVLILVCTYGMTSAQLALPQAADTVKGTAVKNALSIGLFRISKEFIISYEHWLSPSFGIGADIEFFYPKKLKQTGNTYLTRASLLKPFVRYHFGKHGLNGFFLQGNLVFGSHKANIRYTENLGRGTIIDVSKTFGSAGLGLSGGYRFISKGGFNAEAYVGLNAIKIPKVMTETTIDNNLYYSDYQAQSWRKSLPGAIGVFRINLGYAF
ncbi:MAG: hypothetical protein V4543_13670 [Bacteroidota bacterium]